VRLAVATAMILAAGCGRIGFDLHGDAGADLAGDGAPGDGTTPSGDGATDAGGEATMTVPAAADTSLNSVSSDSNYGGGDVFNVRSDMISTFTGLIRFAPEAPPGAVVTAAELRLTTTNAALGSGQVTLYQVLEPWVEGAQIGSAGVASWNQRLDSVGWTSPGCGPSSRADTPVGSFEPRTTNTTYVISLAPAIVQDWLDDPGGNFGLALVAAGTGVGDTAGFSSRESGAGPRLIVELAP
jgi:hypothetical protein